MRDYRLKQGGMVVAGASGPTKQSLAQIMHYAMLYSKEGQVTVQELVNGRWRNVLKMQSGGAL